MHRSDRRNTIVEELRRAGPAGRTAANLAARLDVSVRTIRRDLAALEEAGVPVVATTGPGGGYVLDEQTNLPSITLTEAQAAAVAVALAAAADGPLARDALAALGKVLDVMTTEAQDRIAELAATLPPHPAGVPRTPVTRAIEEALHARRVVALDYADAAGRRTTGRRVEPQLFAFTGGHWYLLAWCLERRGLRWFRWDRIDRAVVSAEPVEERETHETFGAPPPGSRPARRA